MRMLLVNTLQNYKISPKKTRVSLVTFDAGAYAWFKFNDNTNWNQLYSAISNQWEYGPDTMHTSQRNLNGCVAKLLLNNITQVFYIAYYIPIRIYQR
jgi:hypothetical protein